ncbi:MAG: hypothetical protein H0T89_29900 [Deltaproteobacteria bacterium]|nr:hypothetical protein [Deltaproteobacteria bacterium]MDQ3299527.1 hypothetical protein [Myxococcota bacterium]
MKRILKLLLLGSSVAYLLHLLRQTERARPAGESGLGADVREDIVGVTIEDAVLIATESGLADVDPGPLSHVAGEGIDLDADRRAQTSVREQRERMPKGGTSTR